MKNNDINKGLVIAKKAIVEAGNLLLRNKEILSEVISSTNKDIKLKADILAEKAIKAIIENESDYPILAEESGLSSKTIPNIFTNWRILKNRRVVFYKIETGGPTPVVPRCDVAS